VQTRGERLDAAGLEDGHEIVREEHFAVPGCRLRRDALERLAGELPGDRGGAVLQVEILPAIASASLIRQPVAATKRR
jgi:hypothetical protein